MSEIKSQIPNILTTLRLLMVGIFVSAFLNGNPSLSLIMFSTASITDFLDGYLARKWDVTSKYGKTIDPIADKLLMGSALILYGTKHNSLMFLPLIMEGLITFVNMCFITKNKDFKIDKAQVNQTGRVKTAVLMSTISLALLKNLNIKSLDFINDNLINTLILGTTVLQTSTIKGYIKDGLRINNSTNNTTDDKLEYLRKEREFFIDKEKNIEEIKLIKRKDK